MDCPPFLAKPLGLANSRGHWFCKYEAVEKDLDKSSHIFLVSVDGKNDVAIVFKAGDDSYSINWRTDASGRLVLTVYASASEAHIVPNSEYSERFEAEEAIWDKLGKRASPTPTAN